MERKACLRCKGTGIRVYSAFVGVDGKEWPSITRDCAFCRGRKYFEPVNVENIIAAIVNTRTGELRASKPPKGGDRAYYVWRLARFHGGADVCLPIMAETLVDGDPFHDVLEQLSEVVAQKAFGTTMGAANAWKNVL